MLYHKKIAGFAGALLSFILIFTLSNVSAAPKGNYYVLKVYHLKDKTQEGLVDNYLKDFYVPRLHAIGLKSIGVFKTLAKDTTDKRIYVFIPVKNWKKLENLEENINRNETKTGRGYVDANYKNPPYTRVETIIMTAFETRPVPAVPKLTSAKAGRIYELRSYESPTEQYHHNKIKMFNSGETNLFDRIGSNAVFYGSVIAGARMPNLMYMTAYDSMQERDKHWEVFFASPEWKVLVADEQYKNNVSKNDITFLYPANYSDF
ncbi:NIPSNAP family protein [Mucilaginibacter sp.]|uniref:NIPSNAP family protein n=1 Tax=Mucilaginibacter sp. TaxID=1882438 RepID=UPI0035BC68A9